MDTVDERATVTVKKRGRGRPRSTGTTEGDPQKEIIEAASQLFRENGYAKTSISSIARAVGLDQSSMYYWFKSKEALLDQILIANFNSCSFKGKLFHTSAPCEERVFALLYRRTFKYCKLPVDVYEIESTADKNPSLFEQFFTEFESYKLGLRTLVAEGIEKSVFAGFDVDEATWLLTTIILSQQHLYHRQNTGNAPLLTASQGLDPYDEHPWAIRAARLGTAALLSDPAAVDSVEQNARSRGWLFNA